MATLPPPAPAGVAVPLAGFAAPCFTVDAVIDPTHREPFLDEIVGEVREASDVRVAYLALRGG